jgi:hypothetical protein
MPSAMAGTDDRTRMTRMTRIITFFKLSLLSSSSMAADFAAFLSQKDKGKYYEWIPACAGMTN